MWIKHAEKTQNRHSSNYMLGVLCDKKKKKTELKYASVIRRQLIFFKQAFEQTAQSFSSATHKSSRFPMTFWFDWAFLVRMPGR